MNKKGQAAMEFLMTYGWAILAAIIAIGALAWFGVFRPSVPETCTISAPFSCGEDTSVTVTDSVLRLRLGGGMENYNIVSIVVPNCEPDIAGAGLFVQFDGAPLVVQAGQNVVIDFPCAADNIPDVAGAQFRTPITITYTTATGARNLVSAGNLVRRTDDGNQPVLASALVAAP
jgi:hypothetical protein